MLFRSPLLSMATHISWKQVAPSFKDCDLFGQATTLNIGREAKHKTTTGACLSIVFVMAVMAVTAIEWVNYSSRADPTTTLDTKYVNDYQKIDLNAENFRPVVIFSGFDDQFIPSDQLKRYFSVYWKKDIWTLTSAGENSVKSVAF